MSSELSKYASSSLELLELLSPRRRFFPRPGDGDREGIRRDWTDEHGDDGGSELYKEAGDDIVASGVV